ncbi:MAG: hypothetical protein V4489_00740 [Chlamydiota bacterium]
MIGSLRSLSRNLSHILFEDFYHSKAIEEAYKESRKAISSLEDTLCYENRTLSPPLINLQKSLFYLTLLEDKKTEKKIHHIADRCFISIGNFFIRKEPPTTEELNTKLEALNLLKENLELIEENKNVNAEVSRLYNIFADDDAEKYPSTPMTAKQAHLELEREKVIGIALSMMGVLTVALGASYLKHKS